MRPIESASLPGRTPLRERIEDGVVDNARMNTRDGVEIGESQPGMTEDGSVLNGAQDAFDEVGGEARAGGVGDEQERRRRGEDEGEEVVDEVGVSGMLRDELGGQSIQCNRHFVRRVKCRVGSEAPRRDNASPPHLSFQPSTPNGIHSLLTADAILTVLWNSR